jgi:hypothetical protein
MSSSSGENDGAKSSPDGDNGFKGTAMDGSTHENPDKLMTHNHNSIKKIKRRDRRSNQNENLKFIPMAMDVCLQKKLDGTNTLFEFNTSGKMEEGKMEEGKMNVRITTKGGNTISHDGKQVKYTRKDLGGLPPQSLCIAGRNIAVLLRFLWDRILCLAESIDSAVFYLCAEVIGYPGEEPLALYGVEESQTPCLVFWQLVIVTDSSKEHYPITGNLRRTFISCGLPVAREFVNTHLGNFEQFISILLKYMNRLIKDAQTDEGYIFTFLQESNSYEAFKIKQFSGKPSHNILRYMMILLKSSISLEDFLKSLRAEMPLFEMFERASAFLILRRIQKQADQNFGSRKGFIKFLRSSEEELAGLSKEEKKRMFFRLQTRFGQSGKRKPKKKLPRQPKNPLSEEEEEKLIAYFGSEKSREISKKDTFSPKSFSDLCKQIKVDSSKKPAIIAFLAKNFTLV